MWAPSSKSGAAPNAAPTSRRRWSVAVFAAAAAVLGVVLAVSVLSGDSEPSPVITNTPTTASVPTPTTTPADEESEADPDAEEAEEPQPVTIQDLEPTDVADVSALVETLDPGALITASAGSVWAATGDPATDSAVRIDATSGEVTARIEVPDGVEIRNLVGSAASIWVVGSDGLLRRIDSVTNELVATVPIFDTDPTLVHADADTDEVWVRRGALGEGVHELARIEVGSDGVETIDLPMESFHPVAIAPNSVGIGMSMVFAASTEPQARSSTRSPSRAGPAWTSSSATRPSGPSEATDSSCESIP